MRKLHVLFLTSWYPSSVLKSNGDFIQRHAEAVALKHNVSVVHVISDTHLTEKITISDKYIKGVRTLIAYIKFTKNPLIKWVRFIKAYHQLIKITTPFDIIHVNKLYPVGIFAFIQKKVKNTPYIISEHHSIYKQPYAKQITFVEKNISKIIVKNANYVCPVTDNLGKAMQKFGLKGHYFPVPNVVDTKRFFVNKQSDNKVFTILHVSSMAQIKNIKGILRVIKKLDAKISNYIFYLIGGNAKEYITYAKELQLSLDKIRFINQVSHLEISTYFQKADVFILFSDMETFSCVIYEALACGTPVISTNVGGILDYFPNKYGILIEPRNEIKLIKAIEKIYNSKKPNPQKMHNYVEKHFSEERICEAFSKLYDKSLTK